MHAPKVRTLERAALREARGADVVSETTQHRRRGVFSRFIVGVMRRTERRVGISPQGSSDGRRRWRRGVIVDVTAVMTRNVGSEGSRIDPWVSPPTVSRARGSFLVDAERVTDPPRPKIIQEWRG